MKPNLDPEIIINRVEILLGKKVESFHVYTEGADHDVLALVFRDEELVVKVGENADVEKAVLEKLDKELNEEFFPKVKLFDSVQSSSQRWDLLVMSKVQGKLLRNYPKQERTTYIKKVISYLKQVHNIKSPNEKSGKFQEVMQDNGVSWKEYLREFYETEKYVKWSDAEKIKQLNSKLLLASREYILGYCASIPDRNISLIHTDMHQSNIFIHQGKVSGIIDWADAKFGDPIFDFSRFRMNIVHRMDEKALIAYQESTGLSQKEKELEEFYFIAILTDYLLWYAQDGDYELMELNQQLLMNLLRS